MIESRFLDDSYDGSITDSNSNLDMIGSLSDYEKYFDSFTHAFVMIGNSVISNQWQVRLSIVGFNIPTVIYPDAYISPSAAVDDGTVIMPKAVVQSNVRIGKGCNISVEVIIDHDAVVGN